MKGQIHTTKTISKNCGYDELKKYFFIDGSEVIYCKEDFGECKAGNYYLVSDVRRATR